METEREKERDRGRERNVNTWIFMLHFSSPVSAERERGGETGMKGPPVRVIATSWLVGWSKHGFVLCTDRWDNFQCGLVYLSSLALWARAGRRRTSWKPSWSKMTNLSPHTSLRSCWIWTNWVHLVIWCWNMQGADENPYFLAFHNSVKLWLTESAFSHICWVLRFGFRAGTANKTEPLPHSCSKSTELGYHRIWWYEWRWPSGPL